MQEVRFYAPTEAEKLKGFLAESPRLLILTHANPDGDAIGSSGALYMGLKSLGINVDVACIDPVPEKFGFIACAKDYKTDFNLNDYQSVVIVDCGDKNMTRFQDAKPELLTDKTHRINIDHHASNDNFGALNFVSVDACSSCALVYRILNDLEIKITPEIATALLLGIYTDTGGFQHQNTKPYTYQMASELIKHGGDIHPIAENVFYNYELKTLKLWGKVLANLHVTPDGAAIVGVSREDYESLGAERKDLEGVIDYINSLEEARYSVLLSEDEKGNVKASLRTRKPDVDVQALAQKFGGGGHVKAAGFTVKGGHLEKEVKWKIVQD